MSYHSWAKGYLLLAAAFDTKTSHLGSSLVRAEDWTSFVNMSINPHDYTADDVEQFRNDYLLCEYYSKADFLPTGIDTSRVALDGFIATERRCASSNRRIQSYPSGVSQNLQAIISMAQALILGAIGWGPKAEKISASARWGKGSTFSIKGEEVRIDSKILESKITVTQEALPWLRFAMGEDYALLSARGIHADGPVSLLDSEFEIVRGSRGMTVAKNARTDRFIASEPSGNIFLQLGIGSLLRSCLKRVGIDLDSQTRNQTLARLALILGLSTVDLRAASDTIVRELVWLLLPYRWACCLDNLRSHEILIDGRWHTLSKFSSMGNGFTFELESLIFWALAKATTRQSALDDTHVSVYGDDIVIPCSAVPLFSEVLDFVGFEVNTKKTHTTSLFRESCGKHYFNGCDVSPIYQKTDPMLNEMELYRCHNRLLYHAIDRGHTFSGICFADKAFRKVVAYWRSFETVHKCTVPIVSEESLRTLDGGILTDVRSFGGTYAKDSPVKDEKSKRTNLQRGGWWVKRVLAFKPKRLPATSEWAMYAYHMRMRNGSKMVLPNLSGRLPTNLTSSPWWRQHQSATSLAEPFTGSVTARLRGSWTLRRAWYPEACELRWV